VKFPGANIVDPVHALGEGGAGGNAKIVASSLMPSGLTAKDSICWFDVSGNFVTCASCPLGDRLRIAPVPSAK
jgi:hypothetical protein